MTTRAKSNLNIFPHEFGHALFFTNHILKGDDPISKKGHNDDPNNLMYYKVEPDVVLVLEPQQLAAKTYSYLTNPHVLHDGHNFNVD
ncbi:hypothetical protein [Bacillus cereus]|uniref:hypothetical protein n=1 Tax=Bacillus cereus TaxID=1396 RepID=UPI00397FD6C4